MPTILPDGRAFLHVPKTGGKWCRAVLKFLDVRAGVAGHAHATRRWPHMLGPDDQERHDLEFTDAVAIVRHPVAWYRSLWNFLRQTAPREEHVLAFAPSVRAFERSLPDWLDGVFEEFPRGLLTEMLARCEDGTAVQWCRFESLALDLAAAIAVPLHEVLRVPPTNIVAYDATVMSADIVARICDVETCVITRFYA